MAENYDLIILGGGTGGYVAAIRASQLGLSVAIVEKAKLGGTCLHKGCIPSKALLRSAEVFAATKNTEEFGVDVKDVTLNFARVQQRKQAIVEQLYTGVQHLMKKGNIDVYEGHGRILGPSIFSPMPGAVSVEFKNGDDNVILIPKNLIISTGSRPSTLPGLEIDRELVLTSDDALNLQTLPSSILIVGGGVIGIEWASMLVDFGLEVTVLEYADQIVPTEDKEISKEATRILKKKGIKIVTNAKVLPETLEKGEGVRIKAKHKDQEKVFSADKILVSVGRQPNTEDIGLQNTDIEVENGTIITNQYLQTKEAHIYAIGDVIGGYQLAHVASHEGIAAVEHLAQKEVRPMDYTTIAKCIYTNPEMASIGYTEEEAKEKDYDIKVGKFSFKGNGKALVYGQSDGFVKIIADKKTNDLLGVHMIGPHVTDMISEAELAKFLDATPWEIAQTVHPHPTLTEVIGEAALAVDGKAIHN